MQEPPHILVLSEAKAGMMNQARGLAAATGWPFDVLELQGRQPWTSLPVWLWPGGEHGQTRAVAEQLVPPWPQITVSCGRRAAGVAAWMKRKSGGQVFTAHIQDPLISPRNFDLLIVPEHDRLRGPNVLALPGSLPHLKAEKIAGERARFAESVADLSSPRLAVLIGGDNKVYRLTESRIAHLADQLAALCEQGYGLMVSVSRRTSPACRGLLKDRLAALPVQFWDGEGENPYFGWLGLADALLVTADSVNMLSEAAWTGKPVYILEMEEKGLLARSKGKFRRFHASMQEAGYCRPFTGEIGDWTPPAPLRNMERAVERLQQDFQASQRSRSAKAASLSE